jgi:hypothetical protein
MDERTKLQSNIAWYGAARSERVLNYLFFPHKNLSFVF